MEKSEKRVELKSTIPCPQDHGDHADERLSDVSPLYGVRQDIETADGRMLCVLCLWNDALSGCPAERRQLFRLADGGGCAALDTGTKKQEELDETQRKLPLWQRYLRGRDDADDAGLPLLDVPQVG